METTRSIGQLQVSVAGLGCNNFGRRLDVPQTRAVVDAALDAGITFFDTAAAYGESEVYLGQALEGRRDEVVLATKFGASSDPGKAQPDRVIEAAETSLARLDTDYLDCFWLHFPDPTTPIGDTLEALNRLMSEGKVREIGCSNFTAEQLDEAAAVAKERGLRPFAAVQNEYSLVQRTAEAEELPTAARLGLAFVPYFPLASGMLTGKYRRDAPVPEGTRLAAPGPAADRFRSDANLAIAERLDAYAQDHGHTLTELALSWLAGLSIVASVIAGATTVEQVRTNAAATTAWDLTPAERSEIDALLA